MRNLTLAFISGLLAFSAHADIYKWVDKDGRVHFGDRPKNSETAEIVGTQPGEGGTPTDPEAAKQAAERKAQCEASRKQLESYKKADVIKETDALGRTREMTAEERQQLVAITEKQTVADCGPPPPAAPVAEEESEGPDSADDDFDEPDEPADDQVFEQLDDELDEVDDDFE